MGLKAQVTNNGADIKVEKGGLLYIGGDYTHQSGTIFNDGVITIGGNWENNDRKEVFKSDNSESTGTVRFAGDVNKIQNIGGNKETQFPNLVFLNGGEIHLKQHAEARDSLNIGSTEVFTNDKQLRLLNPDPAKLSVSGGVINTNDGGAFVRATNQDAPYRFPLGSKKPLKNVEAGDAIYPVTLTPVNKDKNTYALSMMQKIPDFRDNKSPDINLINDKYYYQIKQSEGSSPASITFVAKPSEEDFNWIVSLENGIWKKSPYFKNNKRSNPLIFELNRAELTTSFKQFTLAKTTEENSIEIYNAFSPNGDGKNDTWNIKNIDYYPDNDLKIYDRSGNLVYKCSGYTSAKNWDGQNNPPGSYYYILRVKIAGEDKYYKGSVTLIKN